jgi:hypothetical protein
MTNATPTSQQTTKTITAQAALTGGCGLWIVAEPEKSKWARKIDWYLNFQLVRAEDHDQPKTASELKEIVQKWHVEPVRIEVEPDAPLMVASAQLLPVARTVLIPFTGDAQAWARVCSEVRKNLQQPATRIFLPESLEAEAFARAWPKSTGTSSAETVAAPIEIVSDKEYAHLESTSLGARED